jgi:hypothetical protein
MDCKGGLESGLNRHCRRLWSLYNFNQRSPLTVKFVLHTCSGRCSSDYSRFRDLLSGTIVWIG